MAVVCIEGPALIWKTVLLWAGISFVELVMLAGYGSGPAVAFWLLEKLVLTPALLFYVIGLKKLPDGAKRWPTEPWTASP